MFNAAAAAALPAVPPPASTPFPHGADPTPAMIHLLDREVMAACQNYPSPRGGGTTGIVGCMMLPVPFAAIAGTVPWVDPVNPGLAPVYPQAAPTGNQVTIAHRDFAAAVAKFTTHNERITALRNGIMAAVPSIFYIHLRDPAFLYSQVHPRTILQHLKDTYAEVTPDALSANLASLSAPWDPSQPIEGLWARQEAIQRFALGHEAISNGHMVRVTATVLETTGVFPETVRAWRLLAGPLQLWAMLKRDLDNIRWNSRKD